MNKIEQIKQYQKQQMSVILLQPKDKKPLLSSWAEFQSRRGTEEEVMEWFEKWPDANIGIVTGQVSGIDVVDFDTEEAFEQAKQNGLPDVPMVQTARGCHLYFKHTDGLRKGKNQQSLPDVDLQADGAYVVAPPSFHESGVQYKWVTDSNFDVDQLPTVPDWVIEKIHSPVQKTKRRKSKIAKQKGNMTMHEGSRNVTLASHVGRWIQQGLSFDETLEQAKKFNLNFKPPLDEQEVRYVVGSILKTHNRSK